MVLEAKIRSIRLLTVAVFLTCIAVSKGQSGRIGVSGSLASTYIAPAQPSSARTESNLGCTRVPSLDTTGAPIVIGWPTVVTGGSPTVTGGPPLVTGGSPTVTGRPPFEAASPLVTECSELHHTSTKGLSSTRFLSALPSPYASRWDSGSFIRDSLAYSSSHSTPVGVAGSVNTLSVSFLVVPGPSGSPPLLSTPSHSYVQPHTNAVSSMDPDSTAVSKVQSLQPNLVPTSANPSPTPSSPVFWIATGSTVGSLFILAIGAAFITCSVWACCKRKRKSSAPVSSPTQGFVAKYGYKDGCILAYELNQRQSNVSDSLATYESLGSRQGTLPSSERHKNSEEKQTDFLLSIHDYHRISQQSVEIVVIPRAREVEQKCSEPSRETSLYGQSAQPQPYEMAVSIQAETEPLAYERPMQHKTSLQKDFVFQPDAPYWRPSKDIDDLRNKVSSMCREIPKEHIRWLSVKDKDNQFLQTFASRMTEIWLISHLGSGDYGVCNKGIWMFGGRDKPVAVKMSSAVCSATEVKLFQEAIVLAQFQNHPNIVQLYGTSLITSPVMVIQELMVNGDLRTFLIKNKRNLSQTTDWPMRLLTFCQQVASGMSYLSSKGFVHRDLTAERIFVSDNRTCKIGDLGFCQDMADDEYSSCNKGRISFNWAAPESIYRSKYSTMSNVWSYGVVMFEIWSFGAKPFEKCTSPTEMLKQLDRGVRNPPPPGCAREIYKIMIQCWHPDDQSRPSFKLITEILGRPSEILLGWPQDDLEHRMEELTLGAPLEAGRRLHIDLQNAYIHGMQ